MRNNLKHDLPAGLGVLAAARRCVYALFRPGGAGAWAVGVVEGVETPAIPWSEDRTVTLWTAGTWNLLRTPEAGGLSRRPAAGDLTCVDTGHLAGRGTIVLPPHRLIGVN